MIMEWYSALLLLIGGVVLLMFTGAWVAFAFFAVNIIGVFFFLRGEIGLSSMPMEFVLSITKFSFVPVALFILMGEIMFQTGVAYRAIRAIDPLIRRLPGRLAIVSVTSGTVFSALTGSTIANTAIMGKVMLPEQLDRGYSPTLAMGSIMAVGGIAMLIPPSALAVLLASLAEGSIKDLLLAGVVPGFLMAALFALYIIVRCWLNPSLAPVGADDEPEVDRRRAWRGFFTDVVPLLLIFGVVVGSIIFKIATPEESAALGCIAAVIACLCYRQLDFKTLMKALRETAKVTTMILFVIAGSATFSQILQISGATGGFLRIIGSWELSTLGALFLIVAVLLFLGAFMDQVSMMLLTLPFFLPLAAASNVDLLALLIIMLVSLEISLLTPPFGLLLFVMQGVVPKWIRLGMIYRAVIPFLGIELFVLALVIFWPLVATWLPLAFK